MALILEGGMAAIFIIIWDSACKNSGEVKFYHFACRDRVLK
jgi:hypothetical protein